MSNDKRIVTLVVELQGDDGNWIWKTHGNNEVKNGMKVLTIQNGDALEELRDTQLSLELARYDEGI